MPFFVDGEEVQNTRDMHEALKHFGDVVVSAMAYHRCPMCGCDLGVGQIDHGYGDYPFVEYCLNESCDYEEYV